MNIKMKITNHMLLLVYVFKIKSSNNYQFKTVFLPDF